MTRSSTAANDESTGRVIAVWRDARAVEHVIVGAVGEEFDSLKAWIVKHHGHEVVDIERRGGDPPDLAPLPAASAAACSTATADDAPLPVDARGVFGGIHVEHTTPRSPMPAYLASRSGGSSGRPAP